MDQADFFDLYAAWRWREKRKEAEIVNTWKVIRFAGILPAQVHTKKTLNPKRLLPLPGDKADVDINYVRQMKDLIKKVNKNKSKKGLGEAIEKAKERLNGSR